MSYKDNHADRIVLTFFPPTGIEPTLVLKKKENQWGWQCSYQLWNLKGEYSEYVKQMEDSVRSVPCGEVTSYWQQSRSSVLQTEKDNRVRAQIRPWLQELEQNYTAE